MNLNLPNKLTIIRMCLTPIFVFFFVYSVFGEGNTEIILCELAGGLLFGAAAFTDFLDGSIARKQGIVTHFGVFLDPLADKFMIFGAIIGIVCSNHLVPQNDVLFTNVFLWSSIIIVLREFAVTSMRLVASDSGIVVPASFAGKAKTVSQIIMVVTTVLESILDKILAANNSELFCGGYRPLSMLTALVSVTMTVWSGIIYLKTYWKYIKP